MSVVIVILAHSTWYLPPRLRSNIWFRMVIGNGAHGVAVFFVISGYLITTLLLREISNKGAISLRQFYMRRAFRIFPPYYAFLIVVALLWGFHVIPEHFPSFIAAVTYTWALFPGVRGYFLFHSWSLSIEEIFYLFWPLFMAWSFRHSKRTLVPLTIILAAPLLRLALHFLAPPLRGHDGYMVQGWIDTMMVGCLLAIFRSSPRWKEWRSQYINCWTVVALAIIGFFLVPWIEDSLSRRLAALFHLTASYSVTAICVGGILVYFVENPRTLGGRLLNSSVLRHVGELSYSLYLWQQLFTSSELPFLPWGYVYLVAVAEFSFWSIEKPSATLRNGFLQGPKNWRNS